MRSELIESGQQGKSVGAAKKGLGRSAIVVAGLACAFASSAKADAIDYLNAMLANQKNPDVTVDYYTILSQTPTLNITGYESAPPTMVTIYDGPGAASAGPPPTTYTTYLGTMSASIAQDLSSFSIDETVDLVGSTPSTLFSSTDILPGGFGTTSNPDIPYWFVFTQDVGTFYAPAGAVVGGLVTDEGDIKEFVFTPAPGTGIVAFARDWLNLTEH